MKNLFLSAFALACAAGAHAQFGGVNVGPNPDVFFGFDPDNPASASVTTPLFPLIGNFIRGLEMRDPQNGFYIASSSISSSPTGVYEIINGVATQIAPMPWTATSVGGLAYDGEMDKFFYAIDFPTGAPYELYSVTSTGSFNLIGQITDGVSNPVIAGLAYDRLGGKLYGLDHTGDQIIAIDENSGAFTPVISIGGVCSGTGGLDFDASYKNLIALTNGGDVYKIDLQAMTSTFTGDAGATTSAIASLTQNPVIKGRVLLGDFGGTVLGREIAVEIYSPGGLVPVATTVAALKDTGEYAIAPDIAPGLYDVRVKASHWLAKRNASVDITFVGATTSFALDNGDVDGDNEVGPGDFGDLAAAFLSVDGDPNWNAEADLDGDGEVGPGDFSILANNFLLSGDL